MSFTAACRSLSKDKRAIVARILREWRSHNTATAQIARNFVNEEQLDEATHLDFLQKLAEKWRPLKDDPDATLAAYTKVCADFPLRGPEIKDSVYLAGRATPYRTFKRYFERTLARAGVPVPAHGIEVQLRALAAGCAANPNMAAPLSHAFFRDLPISPDVCWCTFVLPSRDTTPYVHPRCTASAICEHYGLGKIDPPEELSLLTYRPIGILRIPTIADAGDYYYFRPAPVNASHGWTEPLRRHAPFGAAQPEAVQEGLRGNTADLGFTTVN